MNDVWRPLVIAGWVLSSGCDSYGPEGYDPDADSHAILYGSVSAADGGHVTAMELSGQFVFGNCSGGLPNQLATPVRRTDLIVSGGSYRRELSFDRRPVPGRTTICADLRFLSTDPIVRMHDVQVNLTLMPDRFPADSTRVDVVLRGS